MYIKNVQLYIKMNKNERKKEKKRKILKNGTNMRFYIVLIGNRMPFLRPTPFVKK